jgi:hypothetical protein
MAIQFMDGNDDYIAAGVQNYHPSYDVAYINLGSGSPQAIAGMFSGLAIGDNSQNGTHYRVKTLQTPVQTFIACARVLFVNSDGACAGFAFHDASLNVIVQVGFTKVNGLAQVYATLNGNTIIHPGFNGTLIGTKINQILQENVWYEIEALLTVGATTGQLVFKIAGIAILNYSGINTQGTAGGLVGYVATVAGCAQDYSPSTFFDDFVGLDTTGAAPTNTFLTLVAGPSGPAVGTVPPNGNQSVGLTPSGGSNYANVAPLAFQETTYNYSAMPGAQDLYTISSTYTAIGYAVGTILAVQNTYVVKEDSSGTRTVASVLQSGGTVHSGAVQSLGPNIAKFFDIWQNDPATGAAWNSAKFNTPGSVFPGLKVVA